MPRALTPTARGQAAGREAGFTLFELIVVICIVSVMGFILLDRLQVYREGAEKAVMEQTAAAIKSALQMRVASYMIHGREDEMENLRTENPVKWLQERPNNYAGEFYADAYARVRPGSWYFDLARREFIYVVDLGAHFKPDAEGRKWVRYRVRIDYEQLTERAAPPRMMFSALSFAPVQPYAWF